MSTQVDITPTTLPFPTDDKKQHELRSIVCNFLLITYHCEAIPISIEKVQYDFFRYYSITRADLLLFLEADKLDRLEIRYFENEQVTVFLKLPLSPSDALVVSELEKWRAELAHSLNVQLCTFELSKVNGLVPRPSTLAGTMKTLKMKDILEHDPKGRFEVFGAIPLLYVNRINLNLEEVDIAIAAWKKLIIDFLGGQGNYKKLIEVTTFCPRPRQLPPHHKVLAMLRSDSQNRFHFIQEGGELQVKAVVEGLSPHSSVLCQEWREGIATYLSSQGGKFKSPCDIGVVVHRPTQLPLTYKMLEVLKSDPMRRFDFRGEMRELRIGLRSKYKINPRFIEPKRDDRMNESSWKLNEADRDGEASSIVSAISDDISSVNGDFTDLQKAIEFKFESSDSAQPHTTEPNTAETFGTGGTDTPMTASGNQVNNNYGLQNAPWNPQFTAPPPGLTISPYHWGLNGDFFKPSPDASNDNLDIDPSRLPSVRFTDYTSGDTSHDMWARTGSMSSFYGQHPPRSYSPVRSRSPLRAHKFGTLKPSMSKSPSRATKFSNDTLIPTRLINKTSTDFVKPTMWRSTSASTAAAASTHVDLKTWIPAVLNGFDPSLVLTFVDQMRDDYGFLTTEDLMTAQLGNQLTLDALKDIAGFRVGHFNRIVKGLASLGK